MSSRAESPTRDVVVIGASIGGIEALPRLISNLPPSLPASVVMVQHRAASSTEYFVDIVQRHSRLPVTLAEQGGKHERGHVYVAPTNVHLTFSDGHFNLTAGARENHARPSINRLFRSAAAHYGSRTIGVILTGLLDDGVAGLVAISRVGGETLVQDPASAAAPELPRNALSAVPTSKALPIDDLARAVVDATASVAPLASVPEPIRLESAADAGPMQPEDLDRFAERSANRCHECGGPLWRIPDVGPPRYRCYLGHAMSATDRLEKYDQEVEAALWNAVRALNERSSTLEALAHDAHTRGDEPSAVEFEHRASEASTQARLAYDFMQQLTRR